MTIHMGGNLERKKHRDESENKKVSLKLTLLGVYRSAYKNI